MLTVSHSVNFSVQLLANMNSFFTDETNKDSTTGLSRRVLRGDLFQSVVQQVSL